MVVDLQQWRRHQKNKKTGIYKIARQFENAIRKRLLSSTTSARTNTITQNWQSVTSQQRGNCMCVVGGISENYTVNGNYWISRCSSLNTCPKNLEWGHRCKFPPEFHSTSWSSLSLTFISYKTGNFCPLQFKTFLRLFDGFFATNVHFTQYFWASAFGLSNSKWRWWMYRACSLQADSQPRSIGLVWESAAAWRCLTYVRWTARWTLAMMLSR